MVLSRSRRGAFADIVRTDDPKKNPKQVAVTLSGKTSVEVVPGKHTITLRTPRWALSRFRMSRLERTKCSQ